MCLEALTYGLLVTYRAELDQQALRKWTPKKVLDELLAVDPAVEGSASISIKDPETGEWLALGGTEYRVTATWANKAHNALSHALHVPTVIQIDGAERVSAPPYRERAEKYLPELTKVLNSQSWHLYFSGEMWSVECLCNATMKRRKSAVEIGGTFKCGQCGRQYDVIEMDDEQLKVDPRKIEWSCNYCGTDNSFPEYELAERYKVKCRNCGELGEVRKEWNLFQRDPQAEAPGSEDPVGAECETKTEAK